MTGAVGAASKETGTAARRRIVFMGTPDFAAVALQALIAASELMGHQIVAVYSQPPRPAGRGQQVQKSPVHVLAESQRLPVLDRAMGTLVKDLEQRGKLKDTVIVWMGDFGRTPRINQNAGRDHWSRCWSVVLGGGDIKGGVVYGATDKDGTGVAKDEVSVLELYGTLYKGLGIDPTPETNASVRDNLGRPYYIAGDKPNEKTNSLWIKELVG